jgi:protein gp37
MKETVLTVIGTTISWTNSTWGLAIGCHKVSAGCDHCYAETLVNRLPSFNQRFDEVRLRLERLRDVRKFRPIPDGDGGLLPHMVFVNSLSDFWHDAIPDAVVFQILDVMEAHPSVIFQILTKRPIRARKHLVQRYGGGKGIPSHIWMGVTVEDNQVAKRLDIWRSIKERTGSGTFFVSAEPIIGPTDNLNFDGMDQVITGGESGPGARTMLEPWLGNALANARTAGAAIWHKQNGTVASHPNLNRAPAQLGIPARFRWLAEHGWELLPKEKGGATINRTTYRELPQAYHTLKATLNGGSLL